MLAEGRDAWGRKVNPCRAVYGPGPDGKTCRTCALLFTREFSRRYHKCRLRKLTRGPGSDHLMRFPACGRYEEC